MFSRCAKRLNRKALREFVVSIASVKDRKALLPLLQKRLGVPGDASSPFARSQPQAEGPWRSGARVPRSVCSSCLGRLARRTKSKNDDICLKNRIDVRSKISRDLHPQKRRTFQYKSRTITDLLEHLQTFIAQSLAFFAYKVSLIGLLTVLIIHPSIHLNTWGAQKRAEIPLGNSVVVTRRT